MVNFMKVALLSAVIVSASAPMVASAADRSPTLLIETGPSDNPKYRRMVYVKYLSGEYVTANYKAYNRREFIQVLGQGSSDAIRNCARGASTPLSEIRSYERSEKARKRSGKAPEIRTFCIKNVSDWEQRNKDTYLDPIFSTMPYVKGKL